MFRSAAELAPTLTVSINHLVRDSAPFISPHTLLLVYLPALFILLFLWKIALFCLSAAHPPACMLHLCVRICVLAVGLSTCVVLNLWPQILRRLTTAMYRERGMREQKRIKGEIFSLARFSLSAWIKFLQLPPVAFMDSVCLLKDSSSCTWEGCREQ